MPSNTKNTLAPSQLQKNVVDKAFDDLQEIEAAAALAKRLYLTERNVLDSMENVMKVREEVQEYRKNKQKSYTL